MIKYLFIFKFEMMSSLQYLFNVLSKIVNYFLLIFVFMSLWKYIYSDPNEIINDYSMNQMIWYIVFTEMLWSIVGGRKFCRKIVDDVKGGNIAYNMNKPYNYINYLLASHLGEVAVGSIIYVIVAMLTGFMFLREFPTLGLFSILGILLVSIFAVAINTLLIIFIGLFSFVIEDSNPFYWLYSKMILVLGTIFPIEFFPKILQGILNYSPIYAVCYGPAKLFVHFSLNTFILILVSQIIYFVIGYLLCLLIYKKGVKKLNVNGG